MNRRVILIAAISAALLTTTLTATPASGVAAVNPASSRLFGAWAEPVVGQSKQAALQALESSTALHASLPLVTDYLFWDDAFPTPFATWLGANNRVLLLFVKLKLKNGTRPTWSALATAKPGSQLYADMDRWAAGFKAYGKRMYLVFHKEPNEPLNAVQGTSADYRAAYRAIVLHMRARGVTNVRYVWALPATIFATTATATSWYPGDDVVDVIAGTGSNYYNCHPGIGAHWREFATIFEAMRSWATTLHPTRRIGVVEFETVEDPAVPGHKAQWIANAHAAVKTAPWAQVEVLSYFSSTATDGGGACNWRLTTSTTALASARAWAQDTVFGG
jgi:hypothetical protein